MYVYEKERQRGREREKEMRQKEIFAVFAVSFCPVSASILQFKEKENERTMRLELFFFAFILEPEVPVCKS